jgi:hypothetical protein
MKDEAFVASLRTAEAEALASLSRAVAGLGELAAAALHDALAPHNKIMIGDDSGLTCPAISI